MGCEERNTIHPQADPLKIEKHSRLHNALLLIMMAAAFAEPFLFRYCWDTVWPWVNLPFFVGLAIFLQFCVVAQETPRAKK